jgi:predicted nucleic acid-binding protein
VRAGLTLDAGALIALERGDRRMGVIIRRNKVNGTHVTIPATVLAQVLREPQRQVRIMRLVRHASANVVPLDAGDATSVGRLLAISRTADITDAHVVLCARRAGQAIVTSDPDDLRALDPSATLISL